MNKRWLTLILGVLVVFVLGACNNNATETVEVSGEQGESSEASDFPKKQIEIVVPYSAGGNTDTLARVVSEEASKHLPNGQRYVVVNKEGGGTTIGMLDVANKPADGYTLAIAPVSSLFIAPIVAGADYGYEDFDAIANVANTNQTFIVRDDAQWKSVEEWVEHAKENRVTIGTAGETHKLIAETLKNELGLDKLEVIPYPGNSEVNVALLSKEIDMAVGGLPNVISNDEFRALFSVASERSSQVEDMPLISESGYDFVVDFYNIILAPKGLPEAEKTIISESFKKALESESVQQKLAEMSFELEIMTQEETLQMMEEQAEIYGKLLENL